MKQLVKAFPKDGECLKYKAKLKDWVFVKLDTRKIMYDSNFKVQMTTKENEAWISFKKVILLVTVQPVFEKVSPLALYT